jgi:hypothetical protein
MGNFLNTLPMETDSVGSPVLEGVGASLGSLPSTGMKIPCSVSSQAPVGSCTH